MNLRRVLLALSGSVVLAAGFAAPAAALCAAPPAGGFNVNTSPIVFVGTVDSADETGRIANVIVESVWKGEVDEHVQVQGGPGDPQSLTSVDRRFDVGTRYVFVPFKGNGQVFEDNNCSATQEWTAKVDRQRPDGAVAVSGPPPSVDPAAEEAADEAGVAGTPAAATQEPNNLVWVGITVALAVAAVAAVVLIARRPSRAG